MNNGINLVKEKATTCKGYELDEGSTEEITCSNCKSRNFIRVRELVHNIRLCEECNHTCQGGLKQILKSNYCVACIINKITEFITSCMINKNSVSPDRIEEIVEGWVEWSPMRWRFTRRGLSDYPITSSLRSTSKWELYWQQLCQDKIVIEKGDMYNWLIQLGHIPDLITNDPSTMYNEWEQDEIDRVFYVICQSSQIKDKMRQGVHEGKRILTKRKNLQIKHKSLINYIFDKNNNKHSGLREILSNIINIYIG